MAIFMLLQSYLGGCAGVADEVSALPGVVFAASVEASLIWMGTHGCSASICPGRAGGPILRIIPVGHGDSGAASISAGSGGAFFMLTPASTPSAFDPGHT